MFDLHLNCLITTGQKTSMAVFWFVFSFSQNHRLWLLNLRRRSRLILTGILISPARLQVMLCTHFFKPRTCPVWTVGSMGLGAYSQQLSVQKRFYSGSNDWQNSLRPHYAASFSGFSAQFWAVSAGFFSLIFFSHIIILPHCFVVTLFRALSKLTSRHKLGHWTWFPRQMSQSSGGGWPPFSKACSHRDGSG